MTDNFSIPEPDVSAENPISEHWVWVGPHRPPCPRNLFEHMTSNWDVAPLDNSVHPAAPFCSLRRERTAAQFPGATLVIPTGKAKVRANDTDFRFRPGTDFYYLTACFESDAVLVISPSATGPHSTLYVADRRDHHTHGFFTDSKYGELWVGPRRGVAETAIYNAIATRSIEDLPAVISSLDAAQVLVVRGFDSSVDDLVPANELDHSLEEFLSELRLTKDEYEVSQLQLAVDHTVTAFNDVVRALPEAEGRGERVIEGVFNLRARVEGNDVGYDTIAASGSHATILHWTRNDGVVRRGDMLLLDAGVECHTLYTADVTRTLPINGLFSPAQRRIYDIVYAAQEAGIAACTVGASFMDPSIAATRILVEGLCDLGIVAVSPDEALRRDRQLHRRYTLHGVSHMLGIDVHDCANARNNVLLGELAEGYVLTVEPGLYFQANDLTVPEEYRGLGVRIEDDILVTAGGPVNLSAGLPRQADEVQEWMRRVWADGVTQLRLS